MLLLIRDVFAKRLLLVLYNLAGFLIYYMLVVFIVVSINDLLHSVNPTGLTEC
jgi:hypothetical protein